MNPFSPSLRSFVLVLMATAPLVGAPKTLTAQDAPDRDFRSGMGLSIGYAGVLPDALLGAGAWTLIPGQRFGLFIDAKRTPSSLQDDPAWCPPTIAPCTIAEAESRWSDLTVREVDEYLIFNAGVVVPLTAEFALLAGGGMVRARFIREYFELLEEGAPFRVSENGIYMAPLEESPGWGGQFVVGALFRAGSRLSFRAGYESVPGGMSLGGYLALGR